MVKVASWWRHRWPPEAHEAASEGLRLLYARGRRGPSPQIPPGGRGPSARGRQWHQSHCVRPCRHRRRAPRPGALPRRLAAGAVARAARPARRLRRAAGVPARAERLAAAPPRRRRGGGAAAARGRPPMRRRRPRHGQSGVLAAPYPATIGSSGRRHRREAALRTRGERPDASDPAECPWPSRKRPRTLPFSPRLTTQAASSRCCCFRATLWVRSRRACARSSSGTRRRATRSSTRSPSTRRRRRTSTGTTSTAPASSRRSAGARCAVGIVAKLLRTRRHASLGPRTCFASRAGEPCPCCPRAAAARGLAASAHT